MILEVLDKQFTFRNLLDKHENFTISFRWTTAVVHADYFQFPG